MTGIDELFPEAGEHAPAPLATSRRFRLGLVALVLGLLATAANISAALTALAALTAFETIIGDPASSVAANGNLDWIPVVEVISIAGAGILGLAALVIGVRAARRRLGRGAGIAGAILGILAVAVDLAIAVIAVVFLVAPGA